MEAAEPVGMRERTFRCWSHRTAAEREAGLLDRRLGRRSGRAVPDATMEEVERLIATATPGLQRSIATSAW